MGTIKGSATETTETPDGAHAGGSEFVDTGIEGGTAGPKIEVSFEAGFTQPTVPYGNVRFMAGIRIQGVAGEQDDLMDFAEKWVDQRLATKMQEVKETYPD